MSPQLFFFLDLHFLKIILVCKFRVKLIHLQLCLVKLARMISHFITVQLKMILKHYHHHMVVRTLHNTRVQANGADRNTVGHHQVHFY